MQKVLEKLHILLYTILQGGEVMAKKSFSYISLKQDFIFDYEGFEQVPTINPHFHNLYEIYLFLQGDAVYSVEGNLYEMAHQDILFTNNRELHTPIFKSKKTYERKLIFVHQSFLSEFITKDFNPFDVLEKRPLGQFNKINSELAGEYGILDLFDTIEHYSLQDVPESLSMIKCSLLQMLVSFNKILKLSPVLPERYNKINLIVHYINENLSEDLSLDRLSKVFFISKYHLARLFKEQTGYTIGYFIASKRVLKAKELLTTDLSITTVAQMVGFNDYSSFYRTFKKITHFPPKFFKH